MAKPRSWRLLRVAAFILTVIAVGAGGLWLVAWAMVVVDQNRTPSEFQDKP